MKHYNLIKCDIETFCSSNLYRFKLCRLRNQRYKEVFDSNQIKCDIENFSSSNGICQL